MHEVVQHFFKCVEKWHFQKSFENALERKVYRASYMVKNKDNMYNGGTM
jgi:hypothetical protein